jgi:short-subunit dehydrogenase
MPSFMWQRAEDVVQEGIDAVERGDAVHVTGRFNRTVKGLFKLMPDRMALKMSAKQSKRYRAQDAG